MKKSIGFILSFVFIVSFLSTTLPHKAFASDMQVCPPTNDPNQVRCFARVLTDSSGLPKSSKKPEGYGPAQFLTAYNLSGRSANSQIIGITLALDDPNIKSDLDTFSSTFGLPVLPNCVGSIKNSQVPCFQKLDEHGGTNFSTTVNPSFALELSLDVETAHEICQNCSILVVEGDQATIPNLFNAFDQAITQGATVVSNSWGALEFSGETSFDSHFNHPGIPMTFASGDAGFGLTFYPAASPFVTAVGGTTLHVDKKTNSYAGESAWAFSGSGCSPFEIKPTWQQDTGCANRTTADVSANADPNTGPAIYDTIPFKKKAGWFQVGGTSAAAPLIAGVYALSGNVPANIFASSLPYTNTAGLHDITSGNNGSCNGSYLCTALPGYDGPTGLGTPNGITSF